VAVSGPLLLAAVLAMAAGAVSSHVVHDRFVYAGP
jgi:putative flippase GtrA